MDTKELVKRLRMATTILPPANVCIEAADEIERLRELLECRWCYPTHDYFCAKHKAVRGE